MLEIKPIQNTTIPTQIEMSGINQPATPNLSMPYNSGAVGQCNHPFVDNLLNGISNLILQAVSNILSQIGVKGATLSNNQVDVSAVNNGASPIVEKPSFIERGIDFISNIFGGNFSKILDVFKGASSLFGKAKDIFGKLF